MPNTETYEISIGDSHFEITNCPDRYQRVKVHGQTISDASGYVGWCDDHRLRGAVKAARQEKWAKEVAAETISQSIDCMLEDREDFSEIEKAVLKAAISIIRQA